MRLKTIWTIPAMTLAERFHRTGEWAAQKTAKALPARVRYWAFVQVGAKAMPDDAIVPEARFMDLLERAEGGPR